MNTSQKRVEEIIPKRSEKKKLRGLICRVVKKPSNSLLEEASGIDPLKVVLLPPPHENNASLFLEL